MEKEHTGDEQDKDTVETERKIDTSEAFEKKDEPKMNTVGTVNGRNERNDHG